MRRPASGWRSLVAMNLSCFDHFSKKMMKLIIRTGHTSAARSVSSSVTSSVGITSTSSSCACSSSAVGAEDMDALAFGTWVGAWGAARAMEDDTNDRVLCREEPVLSLAIGVPAVPERI